LSSFATRTLLLDRQVLDPVESELIDGSLKTASSLLLPPALSVRPS